jgi:hypothetical protein
LEFSDRTWYNGAEYLTAESYYKVQFCVSLSQHIFAPCFRYEVQCFKHRPPGAQACFSVGAAVSIDLKIQLPPYFPLEYTVDVKKMVLGELLRNLFNKYLNEKSCESFLCSSTNCGHTKNSEEQDKYQYFGALYPPIAESSSKTLASHHRNQQYLGTAQKCYQNVI